MNEEDVTMVSCILRQLSPSRDNDSGSFDPIVLRPFVANSDAMMSKRADLKVRGASPPSLLPTHTRALLERWSQGRKFYTFSYSHIPVVDVFFATDPKTPYVAT